MPFQSKAQRAYLYIHHPEIAKEFQAIVLEYVKSHYAAYKLVEGAKITNDKNVVTYEAEIGKDGKKWDVLFDASGKFIKQQQGD